MWLLEHSYVYVNYVRLKCCVLLHTYHFVHTACEGAVCPIGSQCRVNQTAQQAYCEGSCDLDNGGCGNDRICSLQQVTCESYPCPPAVKCLSK